MSPAKTAEPIEMPFGSLTPVVPRYYELDVGARSTFEGCLCHREACSFILCRQGSSLLWTPALRPYSGLVHLARERKGIGRCVQCVLATCGAGRLSRSEQLVGYFYSVPLLDVR